MPTFNSIPSKAFRALAFGTALLAVALAPTVARASEVFPGAIQDAADMKCVPTCLLCHTTNPGNSTSWTMKTLPIALKGKGMQKGDADSLTKAWKIFEAERNPMTGAFVNTAAIALVKEGKDQTGADVCGPTYGCGAHVVKHAPVGDFMAPLWVLGALVAAGVFSRRKKATS